MNARLLELDLYFDETGEFLETSIVAGERNQARQKFPSQLAGFLVPRHDIHAEAKTIVTVCKQAARLRPQETFKGSTLSDQQLPRFIRQLAAEFNKRPTWEPVRIVNQEAVCYGDQVAAYTNIFAEMILRILQQKSHEAPDANISIRAYGTTFMRGGYHTTKPRAYLDRVFEYLKFLAVRRGLAPESNKWTLADLVLNFGRERPELLIADVLSNASHNDFKKLDLKSPRRRSPASELLIAAFGDRNWTLTVRELFERVSLLIEEYSFGMALITIAERLVDEVSLEDDDPEFVAKANHSIAEIIRSLARMGLRGRDPQLMTILNWLDQIVGHQRLAVRGYRLAQWLLANVAVPLRRALEDDAERATIEWFEYGLRRWALTAANHQGKLFEAEAEVRAMEPIAGRLARQWEHAPILFDGLIAQAVHLTDAFEFERVANDMRLVAQAMETQADLFSHYKSSEFPNLIKFDLRAKAIGTLVQNEMFKGFADDDHLHRVRALSDMAIEEFVDPKDKARQYQYRCHLETNAGDFASARRCLMRSMREPQADESDFSHLTIRRLLPEANDNPRWNHDFIVAHWLRLGAKICLQEHHEREEFLHAFQQSGVQKFYLESRTLTNHPIHNILRFIAVIQASQQELNSALNALAQIHEFDPIGNKEFAFAMVLIACQAEVAALLWSSNEQLARRLLDGKGTERDGLRQLCIRMKDAGVGEFPRIDKLVIAGAVKIDELLSTDIAPADAKQVLLGIGSEVRY